MKNHMKILWFIVVYKTTCRPKPLRIIFDKVEKYIRKYDSTKYVALFHSKEKYQIIFYIIRYLIMFKSNVSHKYSKIVINSDDDLPLEKTINMGNVIHI